MLLHFKNKCHQDHYRTTPPSNSLYTLLLFAVPMDYRAASFLRDSSIIPTHSIIKKCFFLCSMKRLQLKFPY